MMPRTLLAICAASVLALGVAGYANASTTSASSAYSEAPQISAQANGDSSTTDGSRDNVQVWTVLAAGGAAAIGLVLYIVRVVLGRVQPPPPQEESHH
ncbi:MAG: hypothetical protein WBD55_12080 [Dehalococcoidia bacterium]